MVSVHTFNPSTLPSMAGKTVLITGGTAGLGEWTLKYLAAHSPSRIVFTGRNEAAAESILTTARAAHPTVAFDFLRLDLSSLSDVRAQTLSLLPSLPSLDVLITNAGVLALAPQLTKDGYDIQFATNHMGHALLLRLLLPALRAAPAPRVVTLSSEAYTLAPHQGIRLDDLKTHMSTSWSERWTRYAESKLANMLYAAELARREPHIVSVSIHPGIIRANGMAANADLRSRLLMAVTTWWRTLSPEAGARNSTWAAAVEPQKLESGAYYLPVGEKTKPTTKPAQDEKLAKRLWEWTEEELQPWLK